MIFNKVIRLLLYIFSVNKKTSKKPCHGFYRHHRHLVSNCEKDPFKALSKPAVRSIAEMEGGIRYLMLFVPYKPLVYAGGANKVFG